MSIILVIDDTDEVREILRITLSMEGYKVLTARNGLEGLDKAKTHLPDLIICDLEMPKLDGYQTLEKLKGEPETATIPFIFLTGHADKPNIRRGMQMGADDFLGKPFFPKELIEVVRVRLEKHHLMEEHSEQKFKDLRNHFSLALPHELRTPLNAVLGYSEMIYEDIANMPEVEVKELAQKINQSGHQLLHLIENFLIYAQLEISGKNDEIKKRLKKVEPSDTKQSIEEVITKLGEKTSRKTDIQTKLHDARVNVFSDHFTKITEEMIENALKFSLKGQAVSVSSESVGSRFRLCVQDRGEGMTEDQLKQIGPNIQFERRLHEQQGVGLGLVIARKLVELYEGDFEIKSRPGQGTLVTILLPLQIPKN